MLAKIWWPSITPNVHVLREIALFFAVAARSANLPTGCGQINDSWH